MQPAAAGFELEGQLGRSLEAKKRGPGRPGSGLGRARLLRRHEAAAPVVLPHPSSGRRRWLAVAAPQSSTTATRAPQLCHYDAHTVVSW